MSDSTIKSKEFTLTSVQRGSLTFYRSNEQTEIHPEFGLLFGLAEAPPNLNQKDNLKEIFNIIEYYYFQIYNESRYSRSQAFEQALKSANTEIIRMIQNEEVILDPENINIVIGLLIYNDPKNKFNLLLCPYGDMRCFLIHKIQLSQYKMIDILANYTEDHSNFINLFSNIVSGQISPDDSIFLCNSNTLNYLSQDEIKNIVVKNPLETAVDQIMNLLGSFQENFGGILISGYTNPPRPPKKNLEQELIKTSPTDVSTPLSPPLSKETKIKTTQDSLTYLTRKIKETQKILSPKINLYLKKIPTIPTRIKPQTLKNAALNFFHFISLQWKRIKQNPKKLISFPKKQEFKKEFFPKKSSPKNPFKKIFLFFSKITASLLKRTQKLSPKSKALFAIALFFVSLFYYSVVWINTRQEKQKEEENYRRVSKNIIAKKNQAEASLIYNQETKTKRLLYEIQDLMQEIPQNQEERIQFTKSIEKQIKELFQKVRHMVIIDKAQTLVDLEPFNPKMKLSSLTLHKGKIVTFDPQENALYLVDLEDPIPEKMENSQISNPIQLIRCIEDRLLILDLDQNIYEMMEEGSVNLLTSVPIKGRHVNDIVLYNNRLYLLDQENSQIYRYTLDAKSIKYDKDWVTDQTSLKGALSMSIDGSIHLVTESNQFITLRNGGKYQNLIDPQTIDPPLQKVQKIIIPEGSESIYVLDQNRLIRLNERGQLQTQYINKQWTQLKDVVIKDNEIYLLNGNKIEHFSLP